MVVSAADAGSAPAKTKLNAINVGMTSDVR
jgi:hypothetical protein